MNGNPLDKAKRSFGCLQKEILVKFRAKLSLVSHSQGFSVPVYMPIKKEKTIESLCNFKFSFTKGKAYFHV